MECGGFDFEKQQGSNQRNRQDKAHPGLRVESLRNAPGNKDDGGSAKQQQAHHHVSALSGRLCDGRCLFQGLEINLAGFSNRWNLSRRSGRDGFHLRLQNTGLLVAKLRILLQSAQHDFIEPHVDLHFARRGFEAFAGQFARQHFVKHHAERINVRAVVHPRRVGNLLRRHVAGRADRVFVRIRVCAEHLREAEVGDFHASLAVHEQVLGLDVAVDDAPVVRVLQRVAKGRDDGERLFGREFVRLEQGAQVRAVHILHEQEEKAARLPEVIDGDDVRITQLCQRLRLPREAVGKLRVFLPFRREEFERDETVERYLPRLVNHAHPAAPEAGEDFELREMRGDLLDRRRRQRSGRTGEQAAGFQIDRRKTTRTKPLGGVRKQRPPATRTDRRGGIGGVHYLSVKNARELVTSRGEIVRAFSNGAVCCTQAFDGTYGTDGTNVRAEPSVLPVLFVPFVPSTGPPRTNTAP